MRGEVEELNHGKLSKFDAVDYLDSEKMMAEYLTVAMDDENPDVFLAALSDVAKARGISQLAKDTGLGREILYKILTPGAKPRFDYQGSWYSFGGETGTPAAPLIKHLGTVQASKLGRAFGSHFLNTKGGKAGGKN